MKGIWSYLIEPHNRIPVNRLFTPFMGRVFFGVREHIALRYGWWVRSVTAIFVVLIVALKMPKKWAWLGQGSSTEPSQGPSAAQRPADWS
jgi:phage shock protein PspC (stress-responsive transcriptional regulator)